MKSEEYKRAIMQMIKRIHREEFLIKIYTYVKTLLEMQED